MTQPASTGHLQWATAMRTAPEETRCGDRAVVAGTASGAIIAVIDGLGHGPHAAEAADNAAATLATPGDASPTDLLTDCHAALQRTRGAAISIATITTSGTVQWAGVGNVYGRLVRTQTGRSTGLVTRTGVVGLRLPRLRLETTNMAPGDLLVLFTDGIRETITSDITPNRDLQTLADHLLRRHNTGNDDALVVTVRFLGTPP